MAETKAAMGRLTGLPPGDEEGGAVSAFVGPLVKEFDRPLVEGR